MQESRPTAVAAGVADGGESPDWTYLRRLVRRHFWPSIFVLVAGLAALAFSGRQVKNKYRSEAVAAYDRHPLVEFGGFRGDSYVSDLVETNFTIRLSSPDFLYDVAVGSNLSLITNRGTVDAVLQNMGLAAPESDSERKFRIADYMRRRVFTSTVSGSGVLTTWSILSSPDEAQTLTTQLMERFIQAELRSQVERVALQIGFLKQALSTSQQRVLAVPKEAELKENETLASEPQPQTGSETKSTKTKLSKVERLEKSKRPSEAEISSRIKLLEAQVADMSDEFVRRRVSLEADYRKLESRLRPNHPDVVAKRRELESFRQSPMQVAAMVELSSLRREYWHLRSELVFPGGTGPGNFESRMNATRVAALEDQIEELEIEKASLDRQLVEPASRTKLKVIKSATFEPQPTTERKKQVMFSGLALIFTLILSQILWREMRSPLARDAWRIERRTKKRVVANLSALSLEGEHRRITSMIADQLREHLGSTEKKWASPSRALLAYRSMELAIRRHCAGRCIAFFNGGPRDLTSEFIYNFMNILATDINEPVLLVDLNHIDPLESLDGKIGDALDVIQGKMPLGDVVKRKTIERAFDYLRGPEQFVGERSRMIQGGKIETFISKALEHYKYVFIRGLSEPYYIENLVLSFASTDSFILIDGTATQLLEVERSVAQLDGGRLRGLVLLGV